MYKLVFEKKFPDSSEAVESIDAAGWKYEGRRGLIKKHHLYTGVQMVVDGSVSERHRLRLYQDGYVRLYADYSVNQTIRVGELPIRVWHSEDVFNLIKKIIDEANDDLRNNQGFKFCIEDAWSRDRGAEYGVYAFDESSLGIGKPIIRPAVEVFKTVKSAHQWAVKESQERK